MKTWQKPLFYYISRLTESEEDAWDVMQEVWLRVFRGIRSVRSPEAMPAWLYKVAHNTCMSHLRLQGRRQSMTTEMDDEAAAEIPCPDPQGFSSKRVHEALDELPLLEREALTLHFLEGYQFNEIADITGEPVGTVKSRMFRAKRNLRRIIEREESQ